MPSLSCTAHVVVRGLGVAGALQEGWLEAVAVRQHWSGRKGGWYLDLGLGLVCGVATVHLEADGLARECLDKDLHLLPL